MHLGMSGSFRIDAAPLPGDFHFSRPNHPAHDHVVFNFESGARVTYNDPRRFGFMLLLAAKEIDAHPLFAKLGMEPLDPAMSAGGAGEDTARPRDAAQVRVARSKKHRRTRQYLCLRSASPRQTCSPLRIAGSLAASGKPLKALERLSTSIKAVLTEAIEAGGSSLRDHRQTDGSLGYFQHNFRVYDREKRALSNARLQGSRRARDASGPFDLLLSRLSEIGHARLRNQLTPRDALFRIEPAEQKQPGHETSNMGFPGDDARAAWRLRNQSIQEIHEQPAHQKHHGPRNRKKFARAFDGDGLRSPRSLARSRVPRALLLARKQSARSPPWRRISRPRRRPPAPGRTDAWRDAPRRRRWPSPRRSRENASIQDVSRRARRTPPASRH